MNKFESITQGNTPEDRRMLTRRCRIQRSRMSSYRNFDFWPTKFQFRFFSKIDSYHIQRLTYLKTRTYFIKQYASNRHKNLKPLALFLVGEWSKPRKNWLCHFFKRSFWHFSVARRNRWQFRNPETKQNKTGMSLKENFDLEILFWFNLIWPDIDLSSGRLFYFERHTCNLRPKLMTHETLFIRWPYLTWYWPWPLLREMPLSI